MGVVARPSAVTGLAALSIMAEMTFMPGRHSSSNRSHTAGASGLAWRLISNETVFVAMIPFVVYQVPRGLKPRILFASFGTAEAVPFQNTPVYFVAS